MSDIRRAAVSGSFYPSDPEELRGILEEFLEPLFPSRALGAIAPHAGFVYSGACAGKVFSRTEIPPLCVIIAPNHTGMGDAATVAFWGNGSFATPLGGWRIADGFLTQSKEPSDVDR